MKYNFKLISGIICQNIIESIKYIIDNKIKFISDILPYLKIGQKIKKNIIENYISLLNKNNQNRIFNIKNALTKNIIIIFII